MTSEVWAMIGAGCFLGLLAAGFLWWRMPTYQWYCGRCKKIVSASRLHPRKCACGTDRLTAFICHACKSWNTSPMTHWHCKDCASKNIRVGVEYHLARTRWRWRNQGV